MENPKQKWMITGGTPCFLGGFDPLNPASSLSSSCEIMGQVAPVVISSHRPRHVRCRSMAGRSLKARKSWENAWEHMELPKIRGGLLGSGNY